MKTQNNILQKAIIITIFLWLVIFVLSPTALVLLTSFLTRSDAALVEWPFSLGSYAQLADEMYADIILHSLYVAFLATAGCLALGYPFAIALSRQSKKVQAILLFILIIPFWTNSLIRIYALKLFLSVNGYLNDFLVWSGVITSRIHILYHSPAVIIGLIYILLPFMILPIYSSIEKIDKRLIEASHDLGAGHVSTFFRITLPLTYPGIISGCLLVFIPATGMFYIADMMGGAKNLLIGNIIKNQFLTIRDWPFGSATTIILMLMMAGLLYVYYWVSRRVHKMREDA